MSGFLLNDGQNYFLNVVFKNTTPGDLYVGLMTNGDFGAGSLQTELAKQVGAGIDEVTGTDYARLPLVRNTDWTLSGTTVRKATGTPVEFTVGAGDWANVDGYFVALSNVAGTADAIWAEAFTALQQGTKAAGDTVKVTPSFVMKDDAE